MFEGIIAVVLMGVIGMQWHIIATFQERVDKILKVIKRLDDTKADKDHNHDYISGNMDLVYQGKKSPTVQAHIYPKRIR